MCYRCEVPGCGEVVPAGLDQKKFTQYRTVKRKELETENGGSRVWRTVERQEVSGELRVCHGCWTSLNLPGMTLTQLVKFKAEGRDHTHPPTVGTVDAVRVGDHTLELKANQPSGDLFGQGRRRKRNRRKEGNGQTKPHPARG